MLAGETVPYTEAWLQRLRQCYQASARELTETHWAYGRWLGEQVKAFATRHGFDQVAGVASHGHTIFHDPSAGYTLQIGEGHALHEACGYPVVADFRSSNVAKGGQGAPLVPIGDQLLFGEYGACINLGGYANLSYADEQGTRVAYDIAPCNVVMNPLAQRLSSPYDEGGALARTGQLIPQWYDQLNALPFYQQRPPKSLGQEWLDTHLQPFLTSQQLPQDLLATFVKHLAYQIRGSLELLPQQGNSKVLVTGGGAYNSYLIEVTQSLLSPSQKLVVPEANIVEFKEALVFALLGWRWELNQINCLGSATGVAQDHVAGVGYGLKTQ